MTVMHCFFMPADVEQMKRKELVLSCCLVWGLSYSSFTIFSVNLADGMLSKSAAFISRIHLILEPMEMFGKGGVKIWEIPADHSNLLLCQRPMAG